MRKRMGMQVVIRDYVLSRDYYWLAGNRNWSIHIKALHEQIKLDLEWTTKEYERYYNRKRRDSPAMKRGDRVYLKRRSFGQKRYNIRQMDKLDAQQNRTIWSPCLGELLMGVVEARHEWPACNSGSINWNAKRNSYLHIYGNPRLMQVCIVVNTTTIPAAGRDKWYFRSFVLDILVYVDPDIYQNQLAHSKLMRKIEVRVDFGISAMGGQVPFVYAIMI